MKELLAGENLRDFRREFDISYSDQEYHLLVMDIANWRGVNNNIFGDDIKHKVPLDWHNIFEGAHTARLLPIAYWKPQVTAEDASDLLASTSKAILAYDSAMTDVVTVKLNAQNVLRVYQQKQIPRPELVQFSPPCDYLDFFSHFDFKLRENMKTEFEVNWDQLVELAQSGNFTLQK